MPAQTFYTAVNVADCRDNRHFIHYTNKNEIQYDKNFMTTWQKERNTSYALNKLKIRPSSGWKDASLEQEERWLSSCKLRPINSLIPAPPSRQAIHSCKSQSEELASSVAAKRAATANNEESECRNNLHCAPVQLSQCRSSYESLPHNSQLHESRLVRVLLSPFCQLVSVANQWNVFYTRHINVMELLRKEEYLLEEHKQKALSHLAESNSLKSSIIRSNCKEDNENGICILYILPLQEYSCNNNNEHSIAANNNLIDGNSDNHINTHNCNAITHKDEASKATKSDDTLTMVYDLYCALAEAVVCALPTYSLLDVCELRWKELLSCPSLRLQLRLMHNAKARSLLHMTEEDQNTLVHVALLHSSDYSFSTFAPTYEPLQNNTSKMYKLSSPSLLVSSSSSFSSESTIKHHHHHHHHHYYNKHINYSAYHNADAHLFQCFYVILMLYTIYDIRFTHQGVKEMSTLKAEEALSSLSKSATSTLHKANSRISTAHSRCHTAKLSTCHTMEQYNETFVAFEHPTETNRWLCFPHSTPFSLSIDQLVRLSTYTCVVAQTSKEEKNNENKEQYQNVTQREDTDEHVSLLELSECVLHDVEIFAHVSTRFRTIIEWAATQYIDNIHNTKNALTALFDLFSHKYACSRAELWHLSRTHTIKIYRCEDQVVRTRLHHLCTKNSTLNDNCDNKKSVVECCIRQVSLPSKREIRQIEVCAFSKENVNQNEGKSHSEDSTAVVNETSQHNAHLSSTQRHHEMTSFSVLPDHMMLTHEIQLQKKEQQEHEHEQILSMETTNEVTAHTEDNYDKEGSYVVEEELKEEYIVSPTSPYTHHESLVSRWRQYIRDEDYTVFAHSNENIELEKCIGVGGSGIVYRGTYGARRLLVAVKIFVRIDGVSEEDYIRQSLTDVAFYVLFNQLDDYGICHTCRAHDFIISDALPTGMTLEDATTARLGRNDESVQLCYLVTDLMEGTLGRFLTAGDDDYDEFYDTLHNSPLSAGELFQFLYTQLVIRCIFDWVILDVMLHGQLRGDNMGYQYIHPHCMITSHMADNNNNNSINSSSSSKNATETQTWYWNCVYDGIIVQYCFAEGDEVQYLYFPAQENTKNTLIASSIDDNNNNNSSKSQLMRFIYFVDLGQGLQPSVNDLTRRHLIGETLVDSCLNEDGLGRYWPLNRLYCKYVETRSCCDSDRAILEQVYDYASEVEINDEQDVVHALQKLFGLYAVKYGMSHAPTREQLRSNLVLTWSPQIENALREAYVYRNK